MSSVCSVMTRNRTAYGCCGGAQRDELPHERRHRPPIFFSCSFSPCRSPRSPGRSRTKICSASSTTTASSAADRRRRTASRKFFYLLTCEYCFSHYVSAGVLVGDAVSRFFTTTGAATSSPGWRWSGSPTIFISLYGRLRLGIRSERLEIGLKEAVSERAGVSRREEPAAGQRKAG